MRDIGTPAQIRIFNEIQKRLSRETKDPVEQQIIIELMIVNYCLRMGRDWEKVADGIHKHVKQLIETLQ